VTPAPTGDVSVTIPVTGSDGNKVIVTEIPEVTNEGALAQLEAIGLEVSIVDGEIVIDGTAVDIGTVELVVVLANGETETITFTVDPIGEAGTKTNTTPSAWTGSLASAGSGAYTFTVYVPIDLVADEISKAKDVDATLVGGSKSGAVTITTQKSGEPGRGAGENAFVKITGATTDPDNVAVTAVTYRVGIHKYTQAMNVKLADTAVTSEPETPASPSGSGGSSGCDAGAGSALLLLAGLALAKKKR
jgi:hypothetical protein